MYLGIDITYYGNVEEVQQQVVEDNKTAGCLTYVIYNLQTNNQVNYHLHVKNTTKYNSTNTIVTMEVKILWQKYLSLASWLVVCKPVPESKIVPNMQNAFYNFYPHI